MEKSTDVQHCKYEREREREEEINIYTRPPGLKGMRGSGGWDVFVSSIAMLF